LDINYLGKIRYGGETMIWEKGVEAGGTVYLSGIEGIDPSTGKCPPDIGSQTRIAFDKIKSRLNDTGTDFDHVVKIVTYLVGRENIAGYRDARSSWVKENLGPNRVAGWASTLVLVSGLAMPELIVELDVTAVLP
jgi:2-iminobutanoate/2-iminopropanoate deaminase